MTEGEISSANEETIQVLFIINEGPYGDERTYNALRLATNMARQPDVDVRLFLIGDGVVCAKRGQDTPDGYYNIERMLSSLSRRGEVSA
jgi:uncharacterized protein involved in oxidation of intracellular sulfur